MAHDTYFLNNLTGCPKTPEEILTNVKIDEIVCLTKWQAERYSQLYPQLKSINVINNGIKKIKLEERSKNKKKNNLYIKFN